MARQTEIEWHSIYVALDVDFRAKPAARASERLNLEPPFAPAADTRALVDPLPDRAPLANAAGSSPHSRLLTEKKRSALRNWRLSGLDASLRTYSPENLQHQGPVLFRQHASMGRLLKTDPLQIEFLTARGSYKSA